MTQNDSLHRYDPKRKDSSSIQHSVTLLLVDRRFRIVAVIALVISLVVTILLHRSASSLHEDTAAHGPQPGLRVPITAATASKYGQGCESYGCPIHPPELTDDIRAQIEEVATMFTFGRLTLPYGDDTFAALTQRGTTDQHVNNQDRGVIISPYYARGDKSREENDASTNTKDFFIGIYDGHGDEGHYISRYLQSNTNGMALRISEKLSDPNHDGSVDAVKQSLFDAFIDADKEAPPNAMNGGSTASIIMRLGSKLYMANVGDSTSFVATYDRTSEVTSVYRRNRKDKPHLPEEMARIQKMGGKVHVPPDHPIMARAIAYNSAKRELVGLAMSRSIGDWEHVGVISEPTVDVLDVNDIVSSTVSGGKASSKNEVEIFVVVGSDGIFDARQPQFVANHFAKSFYGKDSEVALGDRNHPIVECANLIGIATPKDLTRYRDDITLLAMKVEL